MFLIILQCSPVNTGNVAVTTNSAGMWNYRLLFMHDFARFASVYTLTQKALCKTIYLHFKSKTFGYFTVQKKHFKMMIDVTTILIITSI